MPRERESQIGLLSGLLAAVMVVALSIMAMTALEPPASLHRQEAQLQNPMAHVPEAHVVISDTARPLQPMNGL